MYYFKISLEMIAQGNMVRIDKVSVSRAVKEKTYYDLKAYCKLRGLSYSSLLKGYVSEASARVLKKDGVDLARLKVII